MADDIRTVDWQDGRVKLIDQTRIPCELAILEFTDYHEVADAIRTMIVRGAPAIGVTAALGIALGARSIETDDMPQFLRCLEEIAEEFRGTRPTAVNLFWAIDRMLRIARDNMDLSVPELKERLVEEGVSVMNEDIAINRAIGQNGNELIHDGDTILTHCNAGALATAAYGTALGVVRAAYDSGKKIKVIADETRPRLQGMKLTAWELVRAGIPVTCITDNMAAWAMSKGMVNCAVVGADRIASNGDVANKVGTYSVAISARAHGIPFYVAAPISTIDFSIPDGSHIPIEERDSTEVTHIGDTRICPEDVSVLNPSFDVTPAEYVTAIITERGILRPPFGKSILDLLG